MYRHITIVIAPLVFLALGACGSDHPGSPADGGWDNLEPVPNPNDQAAAQPLRANPYAVAVTADGSRALVTLRGSELEPFDQIVSIDVVARREIGRTTVGARPTAVRIRPGDDVAIVLSQLSPLAAVVSTTDGSLRGRFRVGYYAEDLAFSADGATLYVTSRADDMVHEFRLSNVADSVGATLVRSAPAGVNPSALALAPDEDKLYVAEQGGMSLRVFDVASLTEIARVVVNAPIFDVKAMGAWMVVTTLNPTFGLPCEDDGDYVGTQGDGVFPIVTDETCGRGFSDLQNEILFVDPVGDRVAIRYTSDSAELSEADREGDYDPALMKVVGSLPNAVAVVSASRAYVTMSASDGLVELALDDASPPAMTMPRTWPTGFAPQGVGVDAEARVAVVADKLGETVTVIDLGTGSADKIDIGENRPPFPSTDAEVGELFFHSAKFSTDGDLSCTHCHPNMENDGKAWGVDIVRAFGRRSTLPMRNLHETKPLLVEGVFDENDFSLEMEAISLRADYHDSSYTLQVQRRDEHYRQVSRDLFGREVGFDEMVGNVAAMLVVEPRLLPSPFDKTTAAVERGRALYFRPDVGCAACHPPPTFASPELFAGVTTLGRYDLPKRDLDPDVSIKYIENARDGFFNANSLRGLWDRRGALFHDGRARTIRETMMTPGHPCLREGELPFNQADGQVDTNGGISHLTCDQIDDLEAFLLTID